MNWGKAGRNAARGVSPPRAQQEERVPPRQDQARQLREAVKGDRLEALFTVTLDPGLRQGGTWARAGLTSTWLVSARLWSRHSLQPVHGQFQLVGPTTARSRRSLDMQQAGPAAYRARQLEERLAAGAAWQRRDLVVCGYFGQFLHGKWVPSTSKRFRNALGYPASTFMTSAMPAHRPCPPRE